MFDDAELMTSDDTGDGYNWDIEDVYLRPSDGTYWLYLDSGCSCNSPYEYVPDGAKIAEEASGPFTFHEIMRRVTFDNKQSLLKRGA